MWLVGQARCTSALWTDVWRTEPWRTSEVELSQPGQRRFPKKANEGPDKSPSGRPDHHQVRPAQNVEGSLSLNAAGRHLEIGEDEILAVIGWMMRTQPF